jgi:hypothetical protein
MMKPAGEPGRRSLPTEFVNSQPWVADYFPDCDVEVNPLALEMGSFPWSFVEYKEQIGFVVCNFSRSRG